MYETAPEELVDQADFLNMCCTGRTALTPRELLDRLLALETASGRRREGARYGPRTLDLDLLLYGEHIVREPELEVPHPRLARRAFALVPLAEIAPEWVHPGERLRLGELAKRLDAGGVAVYGGPVPRLLCGARSGDRQRGQSGGTQA